MMGTSIQGTAAPVVKHYRTFYRPFSIYVGSEMFANGAGAPGALTRLGPAPITRLPVDAWSEIETAPGVYDWAQAEFANLKEAHRLGAEALVPLRMAGAVPAFYNPDIDQPATRAAAVAFAAAYAGQGNLTAGPFCVSIDPRVQESVFASQGTNPDAWAQFFLDVAGAMKSPAPHMRILPHIVGDNHSSYLPGNWLSTVMGAADALGIEESAPLVSTILADVEYFATGPAAGRKIWIVGSAFSTWTGADPRAHGTEADQAAYFGSLMSSLIAGCSDKVEAWIQTSLADAGWNPVWEDHLGLTTPSMASNKPAVSTVRFFVESFPPYHPVFQFDRSLHVEQESPFSMNWYSPSDFEYLDWEGPIDFSRVTQVVVDFDLDSSDGHDGYLLRTGNTWRQIAGPLVDIKPFIAHGDVRLRFMAPTTRFNDYVTVNHLRVTPVVNPLAPDVHAPLIDKVEFDKGIVVRFTDDLNPATAGVSANYRIEDLAGGTLPVRFANPLDSRRVRLRTDPQEARKYRLIVSGVADASGNVMAGVTADTISFQGHPQSRAGGPIVYRPLDVSVHRTLPGEVDLLLRVEGPPGGPVDMRIYDVRGRLLRSLTRTAEPGPFSVWTWRGESEAGGRAPAGVYFVRAQSGSERASARFVLAW